MRGAKYILTVYCGGRAWTQVHDSWLSAQHFEGAGLPLAYDTMLAAVNRGDRLDAAITDMAAHSAYTPVVTRLGCLRGYRR